MPPVKLYQRILIKKNQNLTITKLKHSIKHNKTFLRSNLKLCGVKNSYTSNKNIVEEYKFCEKKRKIQTDIQRYKAIS